MVDQELRRLDDAGLPALRGLAVGRQVGPTDRLVDRSDLRLGGRVIDDHPAVALEVAAHRSVTGDVDAVAYQLPGHRPRAVEPLATLPARGAQEIGVSDIAGRPARHPTGSLPASPRSSPEGVAAPGQPAPPLPHPPISHHPQT